MFLRFCEKKREKLKIRNNAHVIYHVRTDHKFIHNGPYNEGSMRDMYSSSFNVISLNIQAHLNLAIFPPSWRQEIKERTTDEFCLKI